MSAGLTLEEQEIVITMSGRTDKISVFTSYPHWIKRLDKYCEENPDAWKCVKVDVIDGEVAGKFYECPKDLLKLQKKKRFVSEEQRRASAERLASYRQSQNDAADASDDDEDLGDE